MLQLLVFVIVCVAIVALFDGFVLGLDMIGLFLKGVITFIFGGLGVILSVGLVIYMISLLI